MSYHNDPYRVDYLKIYPCLKERPDVLEVLKKSDRKMKYMEVDLKSEQRRKNAENGAESYVPSKEDSLERLVYSAKCQFADDAEGVEDAVIRIDDLCRLRAALDRLSEEERFLIYALFFDERSAVADERLAGKAVENVHPRTSRSRSSRVMCPSSTAMIRSACRAIFSSWVMTMSVWPYLRLESLSSSTISWPLRLSRLPVGSSASTTAGAFMSARPMDTRCCWPPESWFGRCFSRPRRPSVSRSSPSRS